ILSHVCHFSYAYIIALGTTSLLLYYYYVISPTYNFPTVRHSETYVVAHGAGGILRVFSLDSSLHRYAYLLYLQFCIITLDSSLHSARNRPYSRKLSLEGWELDSRRETPFWESATPIPPLPNRCTKNDFKIETGVTFGLRRRPWERARLSQFMRTLFTP